MSAVTRTRSGTSINMNEMGEDGISLIDMEDSYGNGEICTSVNEYADYLCQQISEAANRPKHSSHPRQKMEFYQIVRGGNAIVVQIVLEQLKKEGKEKELVWLLKGQSDVYSQEKLNTCRNVLNVICFVVCIILFLIMTPFFYCVHALVHHFHEPLRRRPSLCIELPLVFAVLSGDPEMVQLFIRYGSDILIQDSDGNNVYHYLADLSYDNPKQAVRCHKLLYSSIETDLIHKCLFEQINGENFTAIEMTTRFGSMFYFNKLTESDVCIGKRRFEVSKENVFSWTGKSKFELSLKEDESLQRNQSFKKPTMAIIEFDVRKYEQQDIFGKQSLLLHFITSRSVEIMAALDASAIQKSIVLKKYMNTKLRAYLIPCLLAQTFSITLSALFLVYIIAHGGSVNHYPLAQIFQQTMLESFEYDSYEAFNRSILKLKTACQGMEEDTLMEKAFGEIIANETDVKDMNRFDTAVNDTILMFVTMLLIVDLAVRFTFLGKSFNFKGASVYKAILPLLYRWIPGSYLEKQLTLFTILPFYGALYLFRSVKALSQDTNELMLGYYTALDLKEELNFTGNFRELFDEDFKKANSLLERVENKQSALSVLFLVCLLLRFFHTIHVMRLLPGIGFFIITTKKMSRHLIQFGIVFVIILVVFATMFHLGIQMQGCPALPNQKYKSISASMYHTFQLTLGHGEYDQYSTSVISSIGYVVCSVVVIIMLLNLIIAVMTTTANDLNSTPWKQVVCKVEVWDEILGIEAQVLTLTQVLRFMYSKLCVPLGLSCPSAKCSNVCRRINSIQIVHFADDDPFDKGLNLKHTN